MSVNYIREVTCKELNCIADDCKVDWKAIVIHQLEADQSTKYEGKRTWNKICELQVSEGLPDIGYHVGIGADGSIWLLRHCDEKGYRGALNCNHNNFLDKDIPALSIVLAVDCDAEKPSEDAWDSLVYTTSLLADAFGIDVGDIYQHSMFDPGFLLDFDAFLSEVAEGIGTNPE